MVLGGCPAAAAPDPQSEPAPAPEPEPEPELEPGQKQRMPGHDSGLRKRGMGASRRRLGRSAEFMRVEVAKLKEANGEDYEPSADDIDRIRAALVGQQ